MYSVVRVALETNVVPLQHPAEAQRMKSAERFLFQGKFGIRNKTN